MRAFDSFMIDSNRRSFWPVLVIFSTPKRGTDIEDLRDDFVDEKQTLYEFRRKTKTLETVDEKQGTPIRHHQISILIKNHDRMHQHR